MHFAQQVPKHSAQLGVMQAAYAHGVKISSPRHLRRRDNLDLLVTEAGGASALALKVGTPKSHISALQSGARGIGDALAAKLERKFDKDAGWLDEDHGAGAPAAHDVVARNDDGAVYIEVKAPLAGEPSLSPDEAQELLAAVLDLPPSKAKELLAQVMMDAEEYRQYGRNVLKRFGAVGGAAVRKAEVQTPIQSEGAAPDQSVMTLNPKPRKLPAHRAISSTLSRRKRDDDTEKKAGSK